MPYGINSAPEIFQKLIYTMFNGLESIVPYMDDVLICGSTLSEHNHRLRAVLERARKYNLRFSKSKMQLAKTEIKFLGHMVSEKGLSPGISKVEAINKMSSPKNKQELQRFLGIIQLLGKSVPNMA